MKTIQYIKIMLFVVITINCNAQTSVVDLLDDDGSAITNTYYKDVNNLLNPFEGTYLYTNGNTSFKIILVKVVQQYNGRYYEDLLIGEYKYIENGVLKVNTLPELSTVYNNQRVHNIDGNSIIYNNDRAWKCPLCATGEKRLETSIRDASTDRYALLFMRKVMVGSQEALSIKISQVTMTSYQVGTTPPPAFSLPFGEYTLIKQ
ncbi:MAG: hypothetical protein H7239_11245 [Flavobacterium sp.]|nr:hypothetical protein [Flavobacterium sp.]